MLPLVFWWWRSRSCRRDCSSATGCWWRRRRAPARAPPPSRTIPPRSGRRRSPRRRRSRIGALDSTMHGRDARRACDRLPSDTRPGAGSVRRVAVPRRGGMTARRPPGRSSGDVRAFVRSRERGSISVVVAAAVGMSLVVTMGAADVGRALIARSRAEAVADLAALAAAQELAFPSGSIPRPSPPTTRIATAPGSSRAPAPQGTRGGRARSQCRSRVPPAARGPGCHRQRPGGGGSPGLTYSSSRRRASRATGGRYSGVPPEHEELDGSPDHLRPRVEPQRDADQHDGARHEQGATATSGTVRTIPTTRTTSQMPIATT